ncbi:MAG: PKD domain-containing protein [Bacteroidota bacterium]
MKKNLLIIISLVAWLGNIQSQTFPNPVTLSTGQGTPGSIDPLWVVSPWYTSNPPNPIGLTYGTALINNSCAPGAWVDPASLAPPMNNGNWITGSDAPCANNPFDGYRYFRLTLNLPPDCNGNSVTTPGAYSLYLAGYADNTISDVFINGNSTGISGGAFAPGSQLNMALTGPWVVGINYVDVLVYNFPGGSSNPYGLFLVADAAAYAAADVDNDGVLDINDQCPCLPGYTSNGCSPIAGDTAICIGESTILTATDVGTYLWNTGSTNASITVSPVIPTTYNVAVTDNNGTHTVSQYVMVNPLPVVAIVGDALLCPGESTTLTASGGVSYAWNTGSTNNPYTITPSATASYRVFATNSNGCKDSISSIITVYPQPDADYTFTDQCSITAIPFNNTSVIPSPGNITNWNWNFGDGITSISQNPSHTYASCGTYNSKLVITSDAGCKDSVTKAVTANCLPLADFSFTNVCLNQALNFNDLSSVSNGTITGWSWNWGDGTPLGNLQNPSHNYTNYGTYSVTLIATSNSGCKDTIIKNIIVHPLPDVHFVSTAVCLGTNALFTDSSSIPLTDVLSSWTWDFDDNSAFGSNQAVSHLYSSSGSYAVQLKVVSGFGCIDSITNTVTVHPNPVAGIINTSVCQGNNTQFTDNSSSIPGTITNWSWDFGDSSPLNNSQNPSYLYANAGTYTVTLISNNNFGCADTVTKPVQVNYLPTAAFTHSDICFNDSLVFTNTSTVHSSTSITSFLWLFGDSSPNSILENPTHFYSTAGTFNVTLLTTTADGCADVTNNSVNVFAPPVASFTVSNSCLTDSALIVNTTLNPPVGVTANSSWNFGDGSPINTTVSNPNHLYTTPGTYTITLIAQSSNLGCADTVSHPVTIYPMPVAAFGDIEVCLNEVMNFYDSSVVAVGNSITNWSWNFNDGTLSSTSQNPSHTFTASGTHSVTLIITSNNGCKDTVTKNIIIHPLPEALFSSVNVCLGTQSQFTDVSTITANPTNDGLQSWIWDYGDGTAVSNNQNASHLYLNAGSYSVELTAVSNFGCQDNVTNTIIINPMPVVNFTANDTTGCEQLCVIFQNQSVITSINTATFDWNFGDGSSINHSLNPEYCYKNDSAFVPNIFNVMLTVTSDSGCVSSFTKNNYITVYPLPEPNFIVQPQTATITDPNIAISNLSIGADFWLWNYGDMDTSAVQHPSPHTYADTGTYTITLITSTQYNCIDTAYQTIIIEPISSFYIPNAFSPNEDGINDTFTGQGMFVTKFEMSIFDRWGNLIYRTDDINKPWNGKINNNNEIVKQDVYVYSIAITDLKLIKHSYRGIVTLLR